MAKLREKILNKIENNIGGHVDLVYQDINDEEAKLIAASTTLTSLNLFDNQIGVEGTRALAGNTTLTSLNLEFNEIGNEGAKAIASNTILISLNLFGNQIGDEGAKAFIGNTTLTSLIFYNNITKFSSTKKIHKCIDRNKKNVEEIVKFLHSNFANVKINSIVRIAEVKANNEKQDQDLIQKNLHFTDACKFRAYQKVNKNALDWHLTELFTKNVQIVTPEINSNVKILVSNCKHNADMFIQSNFFTLKAICMEFNKDSLLSLLPEEIIEHIASFLGNQSLLCLD